MEKTIGILGGGQLGRMLTEAANRLNLTVVTLDAEQSPAKQINNANHVNGSFKDPEAICTLAQRCDILTVEIEHVDTDVLEILAEGINTEDNRRTAVGPRVEVQPSYQTIRIIQDKFVQKKHLADHGIVTAKSLPVQQNDLQELENAAKELGLPFMLKSRTEAYDGRGNFPVESTSAFEAALHALGNRPLYAERWANFRMELAVMVVKIEKNNTEDWKKSTLAFPVVETVHEQSICKLVYVPARGVSGSTAQQAQDLARRAVATFKGKGVFGVEMFLLEDGTIIINEIAPRPHNSGHYTIEACATSQFDAHLRAILGYPIPEDSLQLRTQGTRAIMLNILGGATTDSHLGVMKEAMLVPGATIHMYGKGNARPGRKMGHITVTAGSMVEAERRISPLINIVDQTREGLNALGTKGQPLTSMKVSEGTKQNPQEAAFGQVEKSTVSKTANERAADSARPLVAVTMGSDSDLPSLKPGLDLLNELDIPYFVTITSAHRTPARMFEFARQAVPNGFKVIIAGAGGAAHLPGMIAASTILPVIGVPIKTSSLEGLDSLLSIVQMPRGCPVATVAINNSVNAAQLAVRILALSDTAVRERLEHHLETQTSSVVEKANKLERLGCFEYDSAK